MRSTKKRVNGNTETTMWVELLSLSGVAVLLMALLIIATLQGTKEMEKHWPQIVNSLLENSY